MSGAPAGEGWSAPDAAGVCTLALEVGARATLRGRRRRRGSVARPERVGEWPADWQALLGEWLRADSAALRWASLLRQAGARRAALAAELYEALLAAGLIEVDERRERGRWSPMQLRFVERAALRARLGLGDAETLRAEWAALRTRRFADDGLSLAASALDAQRPALALRRHALLVALERWQAEQRSGTRRDFALYALGHTKAIAEADWAWLDEALDLAAFRIAGHRPLLLMRAPLRLLIGGRRLDLDAAPDCIGLTPGTLARIEAIDGRIGCWRLVENRTSFERAAVAFGAQDAVVWLPGYPPSWWQQALAALLKLCPAPARIACDPDPAGIAIALAAGAPWDEAGAGWQPWAMDAGVLDRLPALQALNDADRRLLDALDHAGLPPALAALAARLREGGRKGEQEGLVLD